MRKFRFHEFANYNDIKVMVLQALDPKNAIDLDSKSILTMKLSDFQNHNQLLTMPALVDIINRRTNRAAIVQAIKDDSTTVGNLVSMLSQPEDQTDPKYLG